VVKTIPQIVPLLAQYGMPRADAEAFVARIEATSEDLQAELARVGNDHSAEVLAPLLEIPGVTELIPLVDP
jgi:hypothetical protein